MDTHNAAPEFESQQARAARAVELATSSPATQAACDIMRLVRSKSAAVSTIPIRFEAANAERGERWGMSWRCDGQSFGLDLVVHGPATSVMTNTTAQAYGDGILGFEVDDETVLALLVKLGRDDPNSRITAVGAAIFEPGPWTEAVVELLQRLQAGADPRTGREAA